jgi:hypothetical protein
MGLIFPDRNDYRPGCAGCGEYAENCRCPKFLTPYTIALLQRMADTCGSPRVRIDLLTAMRALTERNAALSNVLPSDHLG